MEEFFFEYTLYSVRNVLAVLGLLWAIVRLMQEAGEFISILRAYFLSPVLGVGRVNLTEYGSWAVVTGASEGIGRGYAVELARQGLNVVLMSRSKEKLQKVADTIEERHKRNVLILPVDFSSGFGTYERISQQLQQLDIGILVNNVGAFYGIPGLIGDVSSEALFNVTQVNTNPVVQMTRLILPGMLGKKKGLIINISSAASNLPTPQMAVYSATKIFINYVSDGLRKEYGDHGIQVQSVKPYLVATSMSGVKRSSFFVPDAEFYARSAVATIGIQDNTWGCFAHAIQRTASIQRTPSTGFLACERPLTKDKISGVIIIFRDSQGYISRWMPTFMKDRIAWRFTNLAKKRYLAKSQ